MKTGSNNVATPSAAAVKPVYDREYLPPGKYFQMLRDTGQLKPREPKAKAEKNGAVANGPEKTAEEKAADRKAFARRRYFVNKAKAMNEAGVTAEPKKVASKAAPKKVYDREWMPPAEYRAWVRENEAAQARVNDNQAEDVPVGVAA